MQRAKHRVAAKKGQSFPFCMRGRGWCARGKQEEEPQGGCAKGFLSWAGEFGLENAFSLFEGVGGEVLTRNKSQNRGSDLLEAWARAVKALSSVGVPALPKRPPEAANWCSLTAPAGKSPPEPARRASRP